MSVAALAGWTRQVLQACGARPGHARTTADALVAADLCGIDSHGVARLPAYVKRLRTGATATTGEPHVVVSGAVAATVHGSNLLGPVVARYAMDQAIERARSLGVGMVAVRESNHFGIAGHYARMALDKGMVGVASTNAGPRVSPTGAARPFLGTNPLSVAVPSAEPALVVDMATSAVATGKLELARRAGAVIPEGWGVDASGRDTCDPMSLEGGGWLLPLGSFGHLSSHKGFALGLLVEVFAGVLGGGPYGPGVQNLVFTAANGPARVGHFFAAVDPACFGEPRAFTSSVSQLLSDLRALPPSDPAAPVVTPGEPELRCEQRRRREGIPLTHAVLESLQALADDLDVARPATD